MALGVATAFILGIFVAFFAYINDLDRCATPLGIWVVLEWTLGLLQFTIAGCEGVRARLGRWGYFLYLFLVFWSFVGIGMYVIIQIKSPDCISDGIQLQLMCAMIIIFLACMGYIITLCIYGVSFFRRFFYASNKLQEIVEAIKNGFVVVEDYIKANPDIDTYCLFDFETKALKKRCRLTQAELESFLAVAQAAPNTSAAAGNKASVAQGTTFSERVCSICLEGLNSPQLDEEDHKSNKKSQPGLLPRLLAHDPSSGVMLFPICEHLYHEKCLLGWLASKTTCPLCRGGIRSSLYRLLATRHTNTKHRSPSDTPSNKSPKES